MFFSGQLCYAVFFTKHVPEKLNLYLMTINHCLSLRSAPKGFIFNKDYFFPTQGLIMHIIFIYLGILKTYI